MFRNPSVAGRAAGTRRVLVCLGAALLATGLLWVPPAEAGRLGHRPDVEQVRHFQGGPFQHLRWSRVAGARSYQVFVKEARYDERLPRRWTLLKSVAQTTTAVHVAQGQTRQFGVRAVGGADGLRRAVTGISDFGTVSRPARLSALVRVGHWRAVRKRSLYRDVALEAQRPRAKLRLPDARGSSTIRLVAETGRRYGTVDVYVGSSRVKRVDLSRRRHDPDKRIVVRVRPPRSGTVTLVTRGRKPARISALGHTRRSTTARRAPAAPLARPPARSFTVTGAGWGHGVGLSQYGAKAMADAGRSMRRILRHYYRDTSLDRVPDDRLLNVNVRHQVSAVTVRLRALSRNAELRVCAMDAGRCTRKAVIQDRTRGSRTAGEVTMRRGRGGVHARVTAADGEVTRLRGDRVRLRWSGTRYLDGRPAVIRLDTGREYRHGTLLVTEQGSGLLNATVRMRLQSEYLRGVAEMPSSWNLDALRAQAIIARTYALKTGAGRKADCDCHLRDSVVNQSYVGWAKENEGSDAYYGRRWVSAVRSTQGQVLTYRGTLAGTYYFSSSGGHTLSSQDAWSGRVPYLQSVDDPWSLKAGNPNRAWSTRRSQADMAALFGLKDIHKVSITGRYTGGGIRSVRAMASDGTTRTISGKADYMRSRLGLRSAWVISVDEHY